MSSRQDAGRMKLESMMRCFLGSFFGKERREFVDPFSVNHGRFSNRARSVRKKSSGRLMIPAGADFAVELLTPECERYGRLIRKPGRWEKTNEPSICGP